MRLTTACVRRLLPLLLLLTLPAAVEAQYSYYTINGTITITGYFGSGGVVAIPSTIDGLPVASIGDWAFYECYRLTSVMIPNSVTSIGYNAFAYCHSLASVTIGNSVINIGQQAFESCYSLMSVTIPNSVTNIPNSVSSIGALAFSSCTSLTNVTTGNSVTSIGLEAFWGCTSLTSVTIGNSVTDIGDMAFNGCTSLTAITVDALNSVYSSVDGVLFNKSQTTLIQYPGGKAGSYAIPNSVTDIGDGAFGGCASLTSVTMPNSVTNVGEFAFNYCTSLTSVRIGNGVTSIGDGAFWWCTKLTSITIGNSVTSIEDNAFYNCRSLTSVYFVGNAPSLGGSSVFFNDDNATVYYLPGTTGWHATFGYRPALLWNPQVQTSSASFGVRTNQFGFTITGASNLVIVVEACTNLAHPTWSPVGTNTLTGGSSYFSDPQWTNNSRRFYRLRWP